MTDVVRAAIAEELAKLTRIVGVPSGALGFGTDLECADDLTESMREVDAFSTQALAEALVRRLDCPRGALPGDADYGIDLRSWCNRGTTADDVRALAGAVRSEITKDDRVDIARVTVIPTPDGSRLSVQIVVTPIDPRIGGFSLVLAVTSAAVLIEEMRA